MPSQLEQMNADVCPGDVPYALATSATSRRIAIPTAMVGNFCVFTAETVDVYVRFGSSAVAVDDAAVSVVTAEAIAPAVATTEPHITVFAGTSVQIRLQETWTHMADISDDTTGVFRFGLMQGSFGAD